MVAMAGAAVCRTQLAAQPVQTRLDPAAYWQAATLPGRIALREKGREPTTYCLRDPASGLALRWGNDLVALIADELADSWDQLMRMAAGMRARGITDAARARAPRIGVRMAPTANWGLPTPAREAYAPGLAIIAGNSEHVWTVVDGATEDATKAALTACLARQATSIEAGA